MDFRLIKANLIILKMDFNKLSREELIKLVQTQQNQIQRLQRSGLSGKKMKTKIENDNDLMNLSIDFYEASKTQDDP